MIKPAMSMFATAEDYKKAVVEHRLRELQSLGAGDADCAECLGMNVPSIEICKKCIADTPAFAELVGRLMQRADQTPNAKSEGPRGFSRGPSSTDGLATNDEHDDK